MNRDIQDLELLRSYAQDGSGQAFEELVRRHADAVYSSALRRLGDRHLAEDVTQAVFAVLARKAAALKPGTVLVGWLFKATRMAAARTLRDSSRRREREKMAEEHRRAAQANPDDARLWAGVSTHLETALDSLGKRDRNAVLLRFYENGSYAEVGRKLKLTEAAAEKRVSRAVTRLSRFFSSRGIAAPAALLPGLLRTNAVGPAPAGLAAAASTAALTVAEGTGLAAGSALIAQGVLKIMFWAKVKSIVAAATLLAAAGAGTVVAAGTIRKGAAQESAGAAGAKVAPAPVAAKKPLLPVNVKGQLGYIDAAGRMIIKPQFASAARFSCGRALVRKDGKRYFIDERGRIAFEVPAGVAANGRFSEGLLSAYTGEGKKRLWGYLDAAGKWAIKPQYSYTGRFSEGMSRVTLESRTVEKRTKHAYMSWGKSRFAYIDKTGKVLVAPEGFFGGCSGGFSEGLAPLSLASKSGPYGKWGFIDKTGKFKIAAQYDYALPFSEGLAAVGRGKHSYGRKWGFIDKAGKLVIPIRFSSVSSFSKGVSIVKAKVDGRERYGLIDRAGRYIVRPRFEGIGGNHMGGGDWSFPDLSCGLIPVIVQRKWGYIDLKGRFVVNPQFDEAAEFKDGFARVAYRKWGFVDNTGKIVVRPQFDQVKRFSEGLALIWIGKKAGYVNRTGKLVIEPQFDTPRQMSSRKGGIGGRRRDPFAQFYFAEGLAVVLIGDKYGYVHKTGKLVIPARFKDARPFSAGWASVTLQDGSRGFVDKGGKFSAARPLPGQPGYVAQPGRRAPEGLLKFFADGKWGFKDISGKVVVEPQFDYVGSTCEGLTIVCKDERWGWIDTKGKLTFPAKGQVNAWGRYSGGERFSSGGLVRIWTKAGEKTRTNPWSKERTTVIKAWGYADASGKVVIEPRFESANQFSGGLAAVKKNGKWGYINKTGKLVIEHRFEFARPFTSGAAWVSLGSIAHDRCVLIDRTGKVLYRASGRAAWDSAEGLFGVEVVGEGYIDTKGKAIWNPVGKSVWLLKKYEPRIGPGPGKTQPEIF